MGHETVHPLRRTPRGRRPLPLLKRLLEKLFRRKRVSLLVHQCMHRREADDGRRRGPSLDERRAERRCLSSPVPQQALLWSGRRGRAAPETPIFVLTDEAVADPEAPWITYCDCPAHRSKTTRGCSRPAGHSA